MCGKMTKVHEIAYHQRRLERGAVYPCKQLLVRAGAALHLLAVHGVAVSCHEHNLRFGGHKLELLKMLLLVAAANLQDREGVEHQQNAVRRVAY